MDSYGQNRQYDDLKASSLFCSSCNRSTPARERLLLILPDGELYEYRCQFCGQKTGDKKVKNTRSLGVFRRL